MEERLTANLCFIHEIDLRNTKYNDVYCPSWLDLEAVSDANKAQSVKVQVRLKVTQ